MTDCYPAGFDAVLAGIDDLSEEEVDFAYWRCAECDAAIPTGETCDACGLTEDESDAIDMKEAQRYFMRVFGHPIPN